MLKEGKVDLITAVLPFGLDPEFLSLSRPLFTQDEAMGRSQMIVQVARNGFLKKHRAEMTDFIEDYLHTLHYLSDLAHRQEALEIIAEATKQKPSLYADWVFTTKDYTATPTGCRTWTRCRRTSICSTNSVSCARRSRSKNRRPQHRDGSRAASRSRVQSLRGAQEPIAMVPALTRSKNVYINVTYGKPRTLSSRNPDRRQT